MLAGLFGADCSVVFLGSDGGSFAYDVTEAGTEVIRVEHGPWLPLIPVDLSGGRAEALVLVLDAIDRI